MTAALVVIAKAPVPGRVKTRLCPPFTPAQAALLAEAALADTLDAVRATAAARRVLVLDGAPGPWADGFEVVAQRGVGLAARLGHAFEDVGGPALLVGMDTPQLSARVLGAGLRALRTHRSVLGPAPDGGYWAIGLRTPDRRAFAGVPMSRADTGARQRARLTGLGLAPALLPALRDVDDVADAEAVAADAPHTRFAAALAGLREAAAA